MAARSSMLLAQPPYMIRCKIGYTVQQVGGTNYQFAPRRGYIGNIARVDDRSHAEIFLARERIYELVPEPDDTPAPAPEPAAAPVGDGSPKGLVPAEEVTLEAAAGADTASTEPDTATAGAAEQPSKDSPPPPDTTDKAPAPDAPKKRGRTKKPKPESEKTEPTPEKADDETGTSENNDGLDDMTVEQLRVVADVEAIAVLDEMTKDELVATIRAGR